MTLPDRINPDLVDRRNSVVHRGTRVTDTEAQAAITAAAELVDEYEPLSAHFQEPGGELTCEKSPPPALAAPAEVPF